MANKHKIVVFFSFQEGIQYKKKHTTVRKWNDEFE
jgi:hypothetical protein